MMSVSIYLVVCVWIWPITGAVFPTEVVIVFVFWIHTVFCLFGENRVYQQMHMKSNLKD